MWNFVTFGLPTQQAAGHHLGLPVLAPLNLLWQSDHVNKVHAQLLGAVGLVTGAF